MHLSLVSESGKFISVLEREGGGERGRTNIGNNYKIKVGAREK